MKRLLLAAAAALFAALLAVPAAAQQAGICGEHERVVKTLTTVYFQAARSRGMAGDNSVVEVYASSKTGTWTAIKTQANGMTCVMDSGFNYEAVAEGEPS